MGYKENLYCKMFINYDFEWEKADDLIIKLTGGKHWSSARDIETGNCVMSVMKNDDFKTPVEQRSKDQENAFLFWRYFIDIEPVEDAKRNPYIHEISSLLISLWAKGIEAVAACDFEDELPRNVG